MVNDGFAAGAMKTIDLQIERPFGREPVLEPKGAHVSACVPSEPVYAAAERRSAMNCSSAKSATAAAWAITKA